MLENILLPGGLMAAFGLIFGIGLAIASIKLAPKTDPRIAMVRDHLPGANCGGCGFPGCDAYSAAVVEKGAAVSLCAPGGQSAFSGIAKVMGLETEAKAERKVANIVCRGSCTNVKIRFNYKGEKTCKAVALASEGDKACRYACVGYGDCTKVCRFGALTVSDDRIVTVDEDKCTGCGRCIIECPKNVIRLEPHYKIRVRCRALEKGKIVRINCSAGCIGCGLCEKSCKFGAITMKDNLPYIDRSKCLGCLECSRKCPTGAMQGDASKLEKAHIDEEKCSGCALCKDECKFEAISAADGGKCAVDREKCAGCGLCAEKCPEKAITMRVEPPKSEKPKKPSAPGKEAKEAPPEKTPEKEEKQSAESA